MKSLSIPGSSYFVFRGSEGRVRRPRDAAGAAIGALLILWARAAGGELPDWAISLVELVESSPRWFEVLLGIGYLASMIYVLVLFGVLIFGGAARRETLRDLAVVVLATGGVAVLLSFLVSGEWPYFFPEFGLDDAAPRFPVMRVAVVTSVLLSVGPHVTRPVRRFGWLAIVVTAIASVGLSYATPIQTIGSFGIGLLVAGLFLVTVGTPRGYPAPSTVSAGLSALGVDHEGLRALADQKWGLVRFTAIGPTGEPIEVKVHGRDSFDSQLAAKIWRTMAYREMGRTVSYTRSQTVEREALVTLLAGRDGVAVSKLLGVGQVSSEIALIALGVSEESLDSIEEIDDGTLIEVWRQVGRLHDSGISHGQLRTNAVRFVDSQPVLVDFELASLSPGEDDLAGDIVELLFGLSATVGAERAVETASDGLGSDRLAAALPYLQVPAVSGSARRNVDEPKDLINELRARVLETTGVDEPERVELRRVTLKSLIGVGLLLLIGSALIPLFTSVDYAEIWSVLQSADWLLLVVGLIVGHLQFFPQATATMFAVPAVLPFWPLMVLQTASQFISLAIPSAAGRVAMNAAFLHRFGVSVTVAVAQGAIDGFSGFLVQVAIMVIVLLTGDVDLGFDIDTSEVPWLLILGVVALVVVVLVVVVLKVETLRSRIVPIVSQAWGALMVVLRQPSRAIGLLGSNFVYWNLLGLTLWILLGAVGVELSYGSALFVAAGTSLLAGFMPIPGGVGVAEATMTALLVTFGVDEPAAFAVTAVYRLITFYLPALEGLFGSRWLERHDYI